MAYIATQVTGTSPTLTLSAEMSPDGVTWGSWGSTPVVNGVSPTIGSKNVGGSTDYANNGFRYMRLKIQLADTGSPAARLQLYWIGRDYAK